jgi:phospholipid transport system substrate-binding protein
MYSNRLSLACAFIVIITYTLFFSEYAKAEESNASEVVRIFANVLLDSMKRADELEYSGRFSLLEPVIRNSFALAFMVKKSAGRNWNTFSLQQKELLQEVYTEWTIATYAGRFDKYAGESFELLTEELSGRQTITVVSRLVKISDEPIDFHYRLRKIGGQWRIVDIHIAGVSQLALTRSQFVSLLKDKGFNELIARLRDKIKDFSEGTSQ